MQLDFSIFWLDDDEDFCNTNKEQLSSVIQKNGFNDIIEIYHEFDINNYNKISNYDFALIDYDLKAEIYGDNIIEKLRQNGIFTIIVFYSSITNRIKEEIREKNLPGIYIYDRQQIVNNELEKLLEFFLQRGNKPDIMRGILMSEVAKFDQRIWKLLQKYEKQYDLKRQIHDKICDNKKTSAKRFCKINIDKLWNDIETNGTKILDSYTRADILHSKITIFKNFKDFFSTDTSMYKKILQTRNTYAHNEKVEAENKDYIEIRKKLLECREIFDELEKFSNEEN